MGKIENVKRFLYKFHVDAHYRHLLIDDIKADYKEELIRKLLLTGRNSISR